jgi:hypothetical protein
VKSEKERAHAIKKEEGRMRKREKERKGGRENEEEREGGREGGREGASITHLLLDVSQTDVLYRYNVLLMYWKCIE